MKNRRVGYATVAALMLTVAAPALAHADVDRPLESSPLTPILQEFASRPATAAARATAQDVATRPTGRLVVDVRLAKADAEAITALRATGASIQFVDAVQRTVTITIDPRDLSALAQLPGVQSAQQVLQPLTNAACPRGDAVSEGLTQLRANLAATNFSVTGRDVTVGVLSDTYNRLGGAVTDVANGDLPGSDSPCPNKTSVSNLGEGPATGASDEGRAMAQIIHDLAPDAHLLFATAFISEADFAQNIRDLAAAGADIIVDDVTWFQEPMFQDGIIAKAVTDVVADGVTYFSSAANSNKILNGQRVASYEAPALRPVTCPTEIVTRYSAGARCHDFDPGAGTDNTYDLTVSSAVVRYSLGWSEPQYGVTTDLDLCLTNTAGNILSCGDDDNLTTERAFEHVTFGGVLTGDYRWVIVRPSGTGTPRIKLISHRTNVTDVEYPTSAGTDVVGPTIFGHNASRAGVTVAAVPYSNSGVLEDYSSWGPARYCWGPVVGTSPASAINPCVTATVDIAATDGGWNSFFGGTDIFGKHRFYGTSASAPHAAAVAALMLDREQCLTPAQVTTYLGSGARQVGTATLDGMGAGLVDANAALTAAGAGDCDNQPPLVDVQPPRGTASGWYTSASVSLGVSATDRRTVSDIDCTFATMGRTSGIGSTTATGTATTTGEGFRLVTCRAWDAEDNQGARFGSTNTATIKIDSVAPALACRPATFSQGEPGSVVADVTDATSGPVSPTASVTVTTGTPGSFTSTLTAKDVAGNTGAATCGYTVVATPDTIPPTVTCRPVTLPVGLPGVVVADVADTRSGPVTATVSVAVSPAATGSFAVALTGSDQAGNTSTVTCPYSVTSRPAAAISGRAVVKVKKRATYTATGLPPSTAVQWTLTGKTKRSVGKNLRSNTAGASTAKLKFTKTGRYVITVRAGSVTATKKVRVRR